MTEGAAMTVDDVIREETAAEIAIYRILADLQSRTGRRVEWVKVERDLTVTVNTNPVVAMTVASSS